MPRPKHVVPPLTAKHYAAIGRVAIEWSALEGYVAHSVGVFLNAPFNVAKVIASNTQYGTQCEILQALLHLRFSHDTKEVKAIVKLLRTINDDRTNHEVASKRKCLRTRRNEIVHGSWVKASEPPQFFTVTYKARGKLKNSRAVHTVESINRLVDEIVQAADALWDALEPLMERWRKRKPDALP